MICGICLYVYGVYVYIYMWDVWYACVYVYMTCVCGFGLEF